MKVTEIGSISGRFNQVFRTSFLQTGDNRCPNPSLWDVFLDIDFGKMGAECFGEYGIGIFEANLREFVGAWGFLAPRWTKQYKSHRELELVLADFCEETLALKVN